IKQRDILAKERDDLLAELAHNAIQRASSRMMSLDLIQKHIPPDAAIVFWLDELDQHLGCILRRAGPPAWVKLPGSGKDDAWTEDDVSRIERTLAALADRNSDSRARQTLVAQLHRQRITPLEPHLKGV